MAVALINVAVTTGNTLNAESKLPSHCIGVVAVTHVPQVPPPVSPPGQSAVATRRSRWWMVIVAAICVVGISALIVVVVTYDDGASAPGDNVSESASDVVSYKIPPKFCDTVESIFNDISKFAFDETRGFRESKNFDDDRGIVDARQCTNFFGRGEVSVTVLSDSDAAGKYFAREKKLRFRGLRSESSRVEGWADGAFGYGKDQGHPVGVTLFQSGVFVVFTKAQPEFSDDETLDSEKGWIEERLTELAKTSESLCREA